MGSERTYLGTIVDNKDPLYQGRARVRVFGLFDGLPEEDIPWADQISGVSFGGSYGGGNISVPRVGSVVGVNFEENNYYRITYYFIQEISPDLLEELKEKNSYIGTHSLVYDSEAEPGALKIIYTKKKGLLLELGDAKVQLDTQDGGKLRVVIKMGADEIRMENSKVIVNSKNIELGEGAIESVIKGDSFKKFFDTHVHAGAGSPPVVPMIPSLLSLRTKVK